MCGKSLTTHNFKFIILYLTIVSSEVYKQDKGGSGQKFLSIFSSNISVITSKFLLSLKCRKMVKHGMFNIYRAAVVVDVQEKFITWYMKWESHIDLSWDSWCQGVAKMNRVNRCRVLLIVPDSAKKILFCRFRISVLVYERHRIWFFISLVRTLSWYVQHFCSYFA